MGASTAVWGELVLPGGALRRWKAASVDPTKRRWPRELKGGDEAPQRVSRLLEVLGDGARIEGDRVRVSGVLDEDSFRDLGPALATAFLDAHALGGTGSLHFVDADEARDGRGVVVDVAAQSCRTTKIPDGLVQVASLLERAVTKASAEHPELRAFREREDAKRRVEASAGARAEAIRRRAALALDAHDPARAFAVAKAEQLSVKQGARPVPLTSVLANGAAMLAHFRSPAASLDGGAAHAYGAELAILGALDPGAAEPLVVELLGLGPSAARDVAMRGLRGARSEAALEALLALATSPVHGDAGSVLATDLLPTLAHPALGARVTAAMRAMLLRTTEAKLGPAPLKLPLDPALLPVFDAAGALMRVAGELRHEPALGIVLWAYTKHPSTRMRALAGYALLCTKGRPTGPVSLDLPELKKKVDPLVKRAKWKATAP